MCSDVIAAGFGSNKRDDPGLWSKTCIGNPDSGNDVWLWRPPGGCGALSSHLISLAWLTWSLAESRKNYSQIIIKPCVFMIIYDNYEGWGMGRLIPLHFDFFFFFFLHQPDKSCSSSVDHPNWPEHVAASFRMQCFSLHSKSTEHQGQNSIYLCGIGLAENSEMFQNISQTVTVAPKGFLTSCMLLYWAWCSKI